MVCTLLINKMNVELTVLVQLKFLKRACKKLFVRFSIKAPLQSTFRVLCDGFSCKKNSSGENIKFGIDRQSARSH